MSPPYDAATVRRVAIALAAHFGYDDLNGEFYDDGYWTTVAEIALDAVADGEAGGSE